MSNRVKFAAAIAAAGMLAVAGAPAAEAVTVSPNSAVVDFEEVLIGTTASRGVSFEINPATFFFPSVFDLSGEFSFVAVNPLSCNTANCLVTFLFTPSSVGPASDTARIVFNFGATQIERLVTLTGVGVVPVPGALPLFLTGLGGLAYMSRRRKATV